MARYDVPLNDIKLLSEAVYNGLPSFIIKAAISYYHVISADVGAAVYYYFASINGNTLEDAKKHLARGGTYGYKLLAVKDRLQTVEGHKRLYIVQPFEWVLDDELLKKSELLPNGVAFLEQLVHDAETNTSDNLFPAFLKTLEEDPDGYKSVSETELFKQARDHQIRGTQPIVKCNFTMHAPDFLQAISEGKNISSVCLAMLERQRAYYAEQLSIVNKIKEIMASNAACSRYDESMAAAISGSCGETVTVLFERNGAIRSAKMDASNLLSILQQNRIITSRDLRSGIDRDALIYELRTLSGDDSCVTSKDIASLSFRGKVIWDRGYPVNLMRERPDIFPSWDEGYPVVSDEAKQLRARLSLASPEDVPAIKKKLYDLIDRRLFCVVVNKECDMIRHILRVSDDACNRLAEVKASYYQEYTRCDSDDFRFVRGLHNAQNILNA